MPNDNARIPRPNSEEETEQNYTQRAREFRRLLAEEAEKPMEERNFPGDSEWVGLKAISMCETPGCASEGLEFEVNLYENSDGVYRILCGLCGNCVDNVTPLFSNGRGAKLQTRFSNGNAPASRDPKNKNRGRTNPNNNVVRGDGNSNNSPNNGEGEGQ